MSIEILQTMQWSRLRWDLSFEKVIELEQVLPQVGGVYPVHFEVNEDYACQGKAFLLWQPPHSELNGWADQRPSEIRQSYVLEGVLRKENWAGEEFMFEVSKRTALLDLFRQMPPAMFSPLSEVGDVNGGSFIQWRDAVHVKKAKVGDYYYLHGSEAETFLDVIFSCHDGEIYIHYSATLPTPSTYETLVTNYRLDRSEQRLFTDLLKKAQMIFEADTPELKEHQILGAQYW